MTWLFSLLPHSPLAISLLLLVSPEPTPLCFGVAQQLLPPPGQKGKLGSRAGTRLTPAGVTPRVVISSTPAEIRCKVCSEELQVVDPCTQFLPTVTCPADE